MFKTHKLFHRRGMYSKVPLLGVELNLLTSERRNERTSFTHSTTGTTHEPHPLQVSYANVGSESANLTPRSSHFFPSVPVLRCAKQPLPPISVFQKSLSSLHSGITQLLIRSEPQAIGHASDAKRTPSDFVQRKLGFLYTQPQFFLESPLKIQVSLSSQIGVDVGTADGK